MADPVWKSFAIRPHGFGGIATLCSWAIPGSSASQDAVLEVSAVVAPAAVSTHNDSTGTEISMPLEKNGMIYQEDLIDGPCVVSWFARKASGWVAGPTVAANLSSTWVSEFEFAKDWTVKALQQREAEKQPLGSSRRVEIRGEYPRDSIGMPCLSVSFDAVPQGQKVLGDTAKMISPTLVEERVPWTVTLGIVLWCDTPELRDELTPWFTGAMQALAHLAPHNDLEEPTYSISQNEDFSGQQVEVPLFLTTCTFSGTMWSKLRIPVHNYLGQLTV